MSTTGRISSPASTGGAGTFFEQHVAAYWLAQLLLGSIPPILLDCTVVEVRLQTEHLGWHTDDFLVVGQDGSRNPRQLAGQVKRTFTVSSTDDECKKTFQDFWRDFNHPEQFSPATDHFALVTLRGTNTLLEHLSGLLDCSRAARNGAEFESRLAIPGFINIKAVNYCNEIQSIISGEEGITVSAADLWPFLRVLHVLSLDLNSATRQTEAMIKTLLAHTSTEQDAVGTAETSWSALLQLVSEGMPEARSYRREDIPEALRQRHTPIGGIEQRALRALHDHSSLIMSGIHTTIGNDFHLIRPHLVQEVIEKLEMTSAVLISGAAGSGKSVIAKDTIDILTADYFAFSFRVEEFAHAHLDETLQSNQIPVSATTLGAILSSQDRKILLIESVERLLEKSTRDAFTDLLTLVARDKSWHLVLTCRDYSTDLVRTIFLEFGKIAHSVVTVPPLNDLELEEIKTAHPVLALPLTNAALRQVMRNPYILDKALRIQWSEERSLPQSEREFRELFWQEIVRASYRPIDGMPHLRKNAFVEIALRRARSLTPYVAYGDLDIQAVNRLRDDSLLTVSPESESLIAPAHDVLEDWAILEWIKEQYVMHTTSFRDFSAAIGSHPAVRRTYRKWVTELLEWDPDAADKLFQAAMQGQELTAQFRDDTLVSLLRSFSSIKFLERHSTDLFANDKQLLRRVIHLLRVACVTTPAWLETSATRIGLLSVPDGPAWACVLRLVQIHLGSFTSEDYSLLVGLIEDWAQGVSMQTPYPEGAESVSIIAQWLLPNFDSYRSDDQRAGTLKVIAKIPNMASERFATLLQWNSQERNRTAADFQKLIFEDLEGVAAARDIPDILISAAKAYLLCSEAELRRDEYYSGSIGLETLFGIKDSRGHGFFPESAYRGPFLSLFRYHPRQGLEFIIDVFNHSADWYAHPRISPELIEPPFEMTLTFADGASQKQWCNLRLWNLYRGTHVGPHVLQSLLMAFERWLLEYAETFPSRLDNILVDILRQSESAALTSVVASVATAFPHISGEALLVLLRSPICILLDQQRLGHEQGAPSKMASLMPSLDAKSRFYEAERKESDARPHRQYHLETAIVNLQFGSFASRVHEILDRHRAEMPPVEVQDENDRSWRLAMHRMDLRQYTIAEDTFETVNAFESPTSAEDNRQVIRLNPKELEPDVKEMVEKSAAQFQSVNSQIGLLMWGVSIFRHEKDIIYDPAQWQQKMQAVRTTSPVDNIGKGLELDNSTGYIAAICIRDHWEEMSNDEKTWSVDVICLEIEREADHWDHLVRTQLNHLSADRPSAYVLPSLFGKSLDKRQTSRILQVFTIILTHAINEVRQYAALGIGNYMWAIDRDLALHSVNSLATQAKRVQESFDKEKQKTINKRRELDEIEAEVATFVRQHFFERDTITVDVYKTINLNRWFEVQANEIILTILGQSPDDAATVAAFEYLAQTLVNWWDADDKRQSQNEHTERDYQAEARLTRLLENFLLRTKTAQTSTIIKLIVNAIDSHPDKVERILSGLISGEDRQPNTAQFWSLWEQFANGVKVASWLSDIDKERPRGSEMISAIFLGSSWKDEVRHWRSLEGYSERLHRLFEDLPAASIVLDKYIGFLYRIGEQALPKAFIYVAERLQQGNPQQMLRKANTVFMLEVLLQRYVYGKPLELKRQNNLREAILLLLDILVENGSSAAFRMRDDFVTPISINVGI